MTGKTRRISQMNKEREEFLEELRRMQEERIVSLQKSRSEKDQTTESSDQ